MWKVRKTLNFWRALPRTSCLRIHYKGLLAERQWWKGRWRIFQGWCPPSKGAILKLFNIWKITWLLGVESILLMSPRLKALKRSLERLRSSWETELAWAKTSSVFLVSSTGMSSKVEASASVVSSVLLFFPFLPFLLLAKDLWGCELEKGECLPSLCCRMRTAWTVER